MWFVELIYQNYLKTYLFKIFFYNVSLNRRKNKYYVEYFGNRSPKEIRHGFFVLV